MRKQPGLIRQWLVNLFTKASRTQGVIVTGGQRDVWPKKNYKQWAQEAFLLNTITFRSIQMIAHAVASVEWYVVRKLARGKTEDVDDHPVYDLMDNPNMDQGWSEFLNRATSFLALTGNGWLEKVAMSGGGNVGLVKEIYAHRPDYCSIKVNDRGLVTDYVFDAGTGDKVIFPIDPVSGKSDMLHIKLFHPLDDWFGGSPTEPAAREIDSSNAGTEWNLTLLRNQARPGLVMSFKSGLSPEQREDIKRQLLEDFSGPTNAGRSLVLEGEGGVEVEPFGWSPKDMDYLEGGREFARRIALAWGVPPMLLGIPGDNTYSNYKEARLDFWETTVLFYVRVFQDRLSRFLLEPNLLLVPDLDSVPAMEPRRAETWKKAQDADWLTVDEKRELTGYDTLPDGKGNVILVPATMVPLGEEQEEEEDVGQGEEEVEEEEELEEEEEAAAG
jgi:HK97 family phage portal protein